MALAPDHAVIGIRRMFTTEGVHPYDLVEWERRDARMIDWRTGQPTFEQLGVEVPTTWSVNATNILAQKYFRGTLGTPAREWSLRQVVDRITDTITAWGERDGYFTDAREAAAFRDELKFLMITQRVAFNSPVWFNIGVPDVPNQSSACFILSVDDRMSSILNWYVEEGTIFKGGSGAGVNLSNIRASTELLAGGGTASGPVSFMRGADASAGTIKSGGKTRRAAKMVILDADHPDIEEFIWCKAVEERKARVLRDVGFDMDLDGKDSFSIQYQNANNSVRLTDDFMQAVLDDAEWPLVNRLDGEVARTVPARRLMRELSEAAWECADPGIQFDTTINRWHTIPESGRITASNPCFPGSTRVHTDKGLVRFDELFDRVRAGETFGVYTHDITSESAPATAVVVTTPEAFMITGHNPIVRLRFDNGMELRCTPSHRIFTTNRGWVEAQELQPDDAVRTLDLPTPAEQADLCLPVPTDPGSYRDTGDHLAPLVFPEVWSEEFAHYLGWVVGDGSTSGSTTSTIYGSADDRSEILPRHQELLAAINGGRIPKPSEQANGTVQLRIGRRQFKRFLETLGVRSVTGESKVVPWAIEQAPPAVVAAFLRGLYDADGCAVRNDEKGSYVGLGSISPELLRGVQRLLTTFGIASRIYKVHGGGATPFAHTRQDGSSVTYERRASYDLRIASGGVERFAALIGFELSAKQAVLGGIVASRRRGPYAVDTTARLVERSDDGVELTYNLCEPRNHSYVVDGIVVKNCSEYLSVDNSACNLASLNLLRFLHDEGEGVDGFDIEAFRAAIEVTFTAQEILVGNSDYPTDKIGENTRAFRQIGLGYTNLGAMLMALGLPYDSDAGRAATGAVTALMTGHAYLTSARIASRMGPFAGYLPNREHVLRVLNMHREAAAQIDEELVGADLLGAAQCAWDEVCELAPVTGVRNSQATVLAPTGTISFVLDADTTGIEPDLGLVKTKKLVGGGSMSIVNQTVPRALRRLGYDTTQIDAIVGYIAEHKSVLGAPHLRAEHLPVFACSMGDNLIHYLGHVKMLAAAQPFISGSISKTCNLPEEATVDEVELLHIEAWKLGLKCVAIYRDNCKVGQPLSVTKKTPAALAVPATEADAAAAVADAVVIQPDAVLPAALSGFVGGPQVVERVVERIVPQPVRERLPRSRRSRTLEFRVADCKGYVTVGEYADGRPGEIFVRVSKQGSTLAGIMDAFAISLSHGLQYGVPLRSFVAAFVGMRFEPAGMTDDPEIRIASSLIDYLFRRLAVEYLSPAERRDLNILTTGERTQPTLPGVEEAVTENKQGIDIAPLAKSTRPAEHQPSLLDDRNGGDDLDQRDDLGDLDDRDGTVLDVTALDLTDGAAQPVGHVHADPTAVPAAPVPAPSYEPERVRTTDAPLCMTCGIHMQRAGSCFVCVECGSTSGCS